MNRVQRRQFLIAAGALLATTPLAANGRQAAKVARIGYLSPSLATSAHLRDAFPKDWSSASPEVMHTFRQRVVVHRYQMELAVPLWPKIGRVWVAEAQKLRDRLGHFQDLAVLRTFTTPHQPLAPWRSRLLPLIAARQAEHASAAERVARRIFAEKPKAFRRRLISLWEARQGAKEAKDEAE